VIPIFLLTLSILLSSFQVIRVETITFYSADSLLITADEYMVSEDLPYIVLFHEQGASRGEFQTTARRLCKMDYNCLAVDLRNGGSSGFVSNETAKRCREQHYATGAQDITHDMRSAITYAFHKSDKGVILFGSGANGSLSLKLAKESNLVTAVVALSPGEYFLPNLSIQDTIANLQKPVFVTSSLTEYPYMEQLVSGMDEQYVTLFKPELGEGGRGTASLTPENEHNSEYWLALLLFFKDLI
jgi:pimeloyl-ACP methyl ester carboxylesterase